MEKERLKYCIERFDSYFDSVNNKSNIVLGLCTLILGSLITGIPLVNEKIHFNTFVKIYYGLLIGLSLFSMLLLILTSIPHLKSNGKSVHFFKSISEMGKSNFIIKSEKITKESELKDLRKQVYYLANGLSIKFKRLKIALVVLCIQMLLSTPILIALIK